MGGSIEHLHDRRLRNLEDLAIKSRISALDVFDQTLGVMNEIRAHDITSYEQLLAKYETMRSQFYEFADLFQDTEFERKSRDAFLKKHGLAEEYRKFYEKRKMNAVYYRAKKKQRSEILV